MEGVNFTARLDDDSISLNRTSCPAGTKIRIKIPERMTKRIQRLIPAGHPPAIWYMDPLGHYFLKTPSLLRTISNMPKITVHGWLPQPEDGLSVEWRCFVSAETDKI